jgi:CelD/BcsL family acetyltransferase involved in cellulose biosynthesis
VPELNATERAVPLTANIRGARARGARESVAEQPVEITTDIVTTIDGIRALRPDYEHLYRATGNTLPFALQEWHLSWCANFLNHDPHLQERPLFFVLRNSIRECVAIVPLIFTRQSLGPLKLGTVSLIGADPGLTEIRGPLVKPGYERLCVRAVHESVATVPDWDWIQWSGIGEALAEAIARETTPQWCRISDDYVLDLPSSWEEFRAGLKRNVRESLRHCYNSLRRDGHVFEFVVAREREEVRKALGRFLELHALRAKMAWGTEHPNRFSHRSLQNFLYDVCDRLAARDAARVFQLRIGSETVASRIGFVVGDSVYMYYSGFDPAWARYSVMTTTVNEAFKYAIANGLRSVNLSLTCEQSKIRWRPRLVQFRTAIVGRRSLSSRIKCGAYHAALTRSDAPTLALKSLLKSRWPRRNWD